MQYDIIGTGSSGNAVVINKSILIDCGMSYKAMEPYAKNLKLVLLTHEHGDHFKPSSVKALARDRPTLRLGCCQWMVKLLLETGVDIRQIDVYEHGRVYRYAGLADVRPESLMHNVPNCGWHITMNSEKLFYATDTGSLFGVSAKGYDLYLIEANHTEQELQERIKAKQAAGEFSYETAVMNNHLSREQAKAWLQENAGANSRFVFLHQHKKE